MSTTEVLSGQPRLTTIAARFVARALPTRDRRSDVAVELPGLTFDADHVARFQSICGFAHSDRLPATYLHIAAFRLTAYTFSAPGSPVRLGLALHTHNTIEHLRPVKLEEPIALRAEIGDERPHRRGREFDLTIEASIDGVAVWRERSSYLLLRETNELPDPASGWRLPVDAEAVDEPIAAWDMPADLGRRYARVSGDVNPIHLHPLGARALGYDGTVAHGTWTASRVLADLADRLPDAFTYAVELRGPLPIPGTATLSARERDGTTDLVVRPTEGERPALVGRIRPVNGTP